MFWKQFWTGCWNQMSDVPKICSSDGTEHFEQICNQLLAIFIDINNYYPNTNYIQIAGLKSGGRLRLLLFIISKWNSNAEDQKWPWIFWIHWPIHTKANLHEWNPKWTVKRMKMMILIWPSFTDIKTSLMFQVLFLNLHLGLILWNSSRVYGILGFWNSIKIDLADYQE